MTQTAVQLRPGFDVAPGEYELVLESYNTLSKAKSALKTTVTRI